MNQKNKILILGVSGLLGHKLFQKFSEDKLKVYGTTSLPKEKLFFFLNNNTNIFYDFDVNSTNSFLKIFELINPDYVINCVAITSVDSSGKIFSDSLNINSLLPHNLVNFSKIYKFKLIHFS